MNEKRKGCQGSYEYNEVDAFKMESNRFNSRIHIQTTESCQLYSKTLLFSLNLLLVIAEEANSNSENLISTDAQFQFPFYSLKTFHNYT